MTRCRLILRVAVGCVAVAALGALVGCPRPQPAQQVAVTQPQPEAGAAAQLEGTITISGAWALYPMVVKWGEEFRALHPRVRIDVSAGGAGKGVADALGGLVDIGMVSRDIHPDEQSKGAWWLPVCKDAVFPTVNAQNPVLEQLRARGVKREALIAIWIDTSMKTWGSVVGAEGEDAVHVYTRSDACGAAETWAKYLGREQEDLKGTGVYGDPGLAEAVVSDPLGIGFSNLNYVYDLQTGTPLPGLAVLPLDLNGNGVLDEDEDFYNTQDEVLKAIAEDRYPSPPARLLNLLCRDRPGGLAAEFIRWILTEGQQFAAMSGYIPLGDEQITTGLQSLQQ